MGNIHLMNELLSSKIAAGEVVERPASVVKELVENSLDAGATSISVFVAEGGRRLMRVIDDGAGMDREDALLSLKRHATSKIRSEKDLEAIETMGFRGEALSSIAAVSKFTLKSRQKGAEDGVKIECVGGGEVEVSVDGSPEGTSVEIADLFFNTPARAKFMRTAGTEFGRITDIMKRLALAHPGVRFRLSHGSAKSKVIDTAPGPLYARIADIFGAKVFKELVEVPETVLQNGFKVSGYISRPSLTQTTSKGLFIYVNDRPVRDPGLSKAVSVGYSGLLERGRHPLAVLNIELPPTEVDVNVHPAKNEVRFADPSGVFSLVRGAVGRALSKGLSASASPAATAAEDPTAPTYSGRATAYSGRTGEGNADWQRPDAPGLKTLDFIGEEERGAAKTPKLLELEPIGQLWGEFLICETSHGNRDGDSESEFYIIDQHGASERARFESLKKDFYASTSPGQLLLIPERVETSPEEKEALEEALPVLTRFGFEIIPFGPSAKRGGETFMIKAVPGLLAGRGRAVGALILDLVEELSEEGISRKVEERIESALMTIACHSVIRGAKMLSTEEGKALLRELSTIDFAAHCPHGRPVIKRYTRAEVESLFKRR